MYPITDVMRMVNSETFWCHELIFALLLLIKLHETNSQLRFPLTRIAYLNCWDWVKFLTGRTVCFVIIDHYWLNICFFLQWYTFIYHQNPHCTFHYTNYVTGSSVHCFLKTLRSSINEMSVMWIWQFYCAVRICTVLK